MGPARVLGHVSRLSGGPDRGQTAGPDACPTLLVRGERDPIARPEWLERMAASAAGRANPHGAARASRHHLQRSRKRWHGWRERVLPRLPRGKKPGVAGVRGFSPCLRHRQQGKSVQPCGILNGAKRAIAPSMPSVHDLTYATNWSRLWRRTVCISSHARDALAGALPGTATDPARPGQHGAGFLPPLSRWLGQHVASGRRSGVAVRTGLTFTVPDAGRTIFPARTVSRGSSSCASPTAQTVETVLMAYPGRYTACLSTQAGCAMGCVFCATGQMGFVRHLRAGRDRGAGAPRPAPLCAPRGGPACATSCSWAWANRCTTTTT